VPEAAPPIRDQSGDKGLQVDQVIASDPQESFPVKRIPHGILHHPGAERLLAFNGQAPVVIPFDNGYAMCIEDRAQPLCKEESSVGKYAVSGSLRYIVCLLRSLFPNFNVSNTARYEAVAPSTYNQSGPDR